MSLEIFPTFPRINLSQTTISPVAFGAKGDGITNDWPALKAALATGGIVDGEGRTYAIAPGGDVFPARSLLRNIRLRLLDGGWLYWGPELTYLENVDIDLNGGLGNQLAYTNSIFVARNVNINGLSGSYSGWGVGSALFSPGGSKQIYITDSILNGPLLIDDNYAGGVSVFVNNTTITVPNNIPDANAIKIVNKGTNNAVIVANSTLIGQRMGLEVWGGGGSVRNVHISKNHIVGGNHPEGWALSVDTGNHIVIDDNYVESGVAYGIEAISPTADTIVVKNNTVKLRTAIVGIIVRSTDGKHRLVEGNTIFGAGSASGILLHINSNGNIIIRGNTVLNAHPGINAGPGNINRYVNISENIIESLLTGAHGIGFANGRATIHGNLINVPQGTAIFLHGVVGATIIGNVGVSTSPHVFYNDGATSSLNTIEVNNKWG